MDSDASDWVLRPSSASIHKGVVSEMPNCHYALVTLI